MKELFPKPNLKPEKTLESKTKEGVDFVFEQNPELLKIGTKEQYSEYLNNIFLESKVKDIVYHGTSIDNYNSILKEGFDLNKSGSNLGYMGKISSFFTIKGFTNSFEKGAVVPALVNITSKYIDNSGNITEEGLNIVKQKLLDLGIISFIKNIEELNISINRNFENNPGFQTARETNRLVRYLYDREVKNPDDTYQSILKEIGISGLKRNDVVIDMLATDQIYVLGSRGDIGNFEKFIQNNKSNVLV